MTTKTMKHTCFVILCFASLALLAGCTITLEEGETRFYGLFIGINDYQDGSVPDLSWCEADALGVRGALSARGWDGAELTDGDFANGELFTRIGAAATRAQILADIGALVDSAGTGDYILVFYSGHGTSIPDVDGDESDGYDEAIVPFDYEWGNDPTLILDDELRAVFARSRTGKGAVIFDSCNSGGMINKGIDGKGFAPRSFGNRDTGGGASNGDLDILDLPVLAAAGQNEDSWEFAALGHGVFSFFLIEGLQRLGTDGNNDGRISIREWFDYAEINTESYSSFFSYTSQHPQLLFDRDFIDILVTR
jgi:uncharacterized caspase-like protein